MIKLWLPLATLLLSPATARDAVDVRLTIVADGTRKDAALGRWDDDEHYGTDQDRNYTLLKKMPSVPLEKRPSEKMWRLVLYPGRRLQTIKGLGGAMTDSSAYLLQELKKRNPALYRYCMQRMFSPHDGAGFSYIRRPVGSSDYTAAKQPPATQKRIPSNWSRRYSPIPRSAPWPPGPPGTATPAAPLK